MTSQKRTLCCLGGGNPIEKSVFTRDYQIFLRHLRAARERQGITQIQLAERLGETQSTVSKCERGEKRLDIVEVMTFCRALEVSFAEFSTELERLVEEDRRAGSTAS